jgi:predicted MFS family arabinose efflux permease
MGMAFALLYPSLSLVAISSVSESRRGSALGTFTAFFDIGIGLGGVLTGIAASVGGYPAAFWLGSACAVGTGLVATRALGRASPSPEVTAP